MAARATRSMVKNRIAAKWPTAFPLNYPQVERFFAEKGPAKGGLPVMFLFCSSVKQFGEGQGKPLLLPTA
jgi:hypothetical protein